jgi:hypothetical protein
MFDEGLLAELDETADVREKGRSAVLRELASDFLQRRREREIDVRYERAYKEVKEPLGIWLYQAPRWRSVQHRVEAACRLSLRRASRSHPGDDAGHPGRVTRIARAGIAARPDRAGATAFAKRRPTPKELLLLQPGGLRGMAGEAPNMRGGRLAGPGGSSGTPGEVFAGPGESSEATGELLAGSGGSSGTPGEVFAGPGGSTETAGELLAGFTTPLAGAGG